MSRDPFDSLPAPDRNKFGVALKRPLTRALNSLERFCNSIVAGRYPEWPSSSELSMFLKQVETFRLISNRGSDADPMQLIRDMDHRWPGMHIARTLERVVSTIETYIGRSLLAEVHTEAIKDRRDPKKTELHSLVYKLRNAKPADLELMAPLLPDPFQDLLELTRKETLRAQSEAALKTVERRRSALARSAQEYLFSTQLVCLARLWAAGKLRAFIHELKDPQYTKRLHGLAPEHVEDWDKAERRERVRKQVRERVKRFRDQKKSAG